MTEKELSELYHGLVFTVLYSRIHLPGYLNE